MRFNGNCRHGYHTYPENAEVGPNCDQPWDSERHAKILCAKELLLTNVERELPSRLEMNRRFDTTFGTEENMRLVPAAQILKVSLYENRLLAYAFYQYLKGWEDSLLTTYDEADECRCFDVDV